MRRLQRIGILRTDSGASLVRADLARGAAPDAAESIARILDGEAGRD